MKTIVMKFGGASVSKPEQFAHIADIILTRSITFSKLIIVVSAMGDTTDQLLSLAYKVNPEPPRRELDMLVSVGERISISLLAMALAAKGREAISFTGSQSGIITNSCHTDALITDVKPQRLKPHLEQGKIVIVAGFQGVSKGGEITTLGRGGSDTTAVALGAALNAERVEFYKDVPGIFSEDPKKCQGAAHYLKLSFAEALNIVERGAKVLHPRSVRLAAKNFLPLLIRSFNDPEGVNDAGTIIGDPSLELRESSPSYEEALFG